MLSEQTGEVKVITEDMERLIREGALNIEDFKNKSFFLTGATGCIINYVAKLLIILNRTFDLNMQIYLHGRSEERILQRFDKVYFDKSVKPAIFSIEKPIPQNIYAEYIIHGASPASTNEILNKPVEVITPNVLCTYNMLEHAQHIGAKLLFTSSVGIYGDLSIIDKKYIAETDLGVTDPLSDRACYEQSKKLGETMCYAYFNEYNVKTSIARLPYSYGPVYELSKDTRVIPRTIKTLLNPPKDLKTIALFDDPRPLQYSYLGDVATGIFTLLFKGECGAVYNVASNLTMSLQDMIQILIDNSDTDIKLELKKIDDEYYFAKKAVVRLMDNSKLKSLGWKECCDYNYGIKQTIRRYILK